MQLNEAVAAVSPAVVGFIPKYMPGSEPIPPGHFPIIGTGFIVGDGLVATNNHVVEALAKLPKPPDVPHAEWPFVAFIGVFLEKKKYPNLPMDGFARAPLDVIGVVKVGELEMKGSGYYYGSRKPDLSIVHVKAKGLPHLDPLDDTSLLREGEEVATIGYPMGTDALAAPGWMHQLVPFLQRGIISAVLPFPCIAPHSFVINLMSIGGASGSPVFLSHDPRPIGILNAGLNDLSPSFVKSGANTFHGMTKTATNFSYVVPSYFLKPMIEEIKKNPIFNLPLDTLSLEEIIQKGTPELMKKPGHNEPPIADTWIGSPTGTIQVEINPVKPESTDPAKQG